MVCDTEKPNLSGYSSNSLRNSVDLPEPDGPHTISSREFCCTIVSVEIVAVAATVPDPGTARDATEMAKNDNRQPRYNDEWTFEVVSR